MPLGKIAIRIMRRDTYSPFNLALKQALDMKHSPFGRALKQSHSPVIAPSIQSAPGGQSCHALLSAAASLLLHSSCHAFHWSGKKGSMTFSSTHGARANATPTRNGTMSRATLRNAKEAPATLAWSSWFARLGHSPVAYA